MPAQRHGVRANSSRFLVSLLLSSVPVASAFFVPLSTHASSGIASRHAAFSLRPSGVARRSGTVSPLALRMGAKLIKVRALPQPPPARLRGERTRDAGGPSAAWTLLQRVALCLGGTSPGLVKSAWRRWGRPRLHSPTPQPCPRPRPRGADRTGAQDHGGNQDFCIAVLGDLHLDPADMALHEEVLPRSLLSCCWPASAQHVALWHCVSAPARSMFPKSVVASSPCPHVCR
jgi:hypothetical protein